MRMRDLLLLLCCVLFATACRPREKREMPPAFIDSYLQTYIDDFVKDAKKANVAIGGDRIGRLRIVKFVDSIEDQKRSMGQQVPAGEELAGACTEVEIDDTIDTGFGKKKKGEQIWQEIWISNSITGDQDTPALIMRELMYHELGHCLLGLEHAPAEPHKIMSPAVSGDPKFLQKNWSRLLRELFEAGKGH